jgi:hypothetical protein
MKNNMHLQELRKQIDEIIAGRHVYEINEYPVDKNMEDSTIYKGSWCRLNKCHKF